MIVTFSHSNDLGNYSLKSMLIETLNEFLRKNGVGDITNSNGISKDLSFKWDCANDSYTKAFGLLFLLFTEDNPFAYIEYRPTHVSICLRYFKDEDECIKNLIIYIRSKMNVYIKF